MKNLSLHHMQQCLAQDGSIEFNERERGPCFTTQVVFLFQVHPHDSSYCCTARLQSILSLTAVKSEPPLTVHQKSADVLPIGSAPVGSLLTAVRDRTKTSPRTTQGWRECSPYYALVMGVSPKNEQT